MESNEITQALFEQHTNITLKEFAKITFVAIKVRKDNLMYLFFNDAIAFSVDAYNPHAINHALSCNLEPEKIYSENEILNNSQTHPKRKLIYTFTTHGHYDHAGGNEELQKMFPQTKQISFSDVLNEDIIQVPISETEKINVKCLLTPAHTLDSVCYLVNEQWLTTGDFIFKIGCGKFFEGNADDFKKSFENIVKNCSPKTKMLYGHDYFENNLRFASTKREYSDEELFYMNKNFLMNLSDEMRLNPFLNSEEIEKLRKEKDEFK